MERAALDLARGPEDLVRLLVDAVEEYAIFMLDAEGRILSWNAGAERVKGYAAGEAIGRHFSMFYPAEQIGQGEPDRELREAERQGQYEAEDWRIRKDGSRFWANVVIRPVRRPDGGLVGFAKVTRDLTARRRAEETALRLATDHAAREAAERAAERMTVLARASRALDGAVRDPKQLAGVAQTLVPVLAEVPHRPEAGGGAQAGRDRARAAGEGGLAETRRAGGSGAAGGQRDDRSAEDRPFAARSRGI